MPTLPDLALPSWGRRAGKTLKGPGGRDDPLNWEGKTIIRGKIFNQRWETDPRGKEREKK